jgi:hypothetical protein
MKRIVKPGLFILCFPVVYFVTIFILANIYYGDQKQLFQNAIGNRVVPGGFGQTLRRFRESDGVKDIDILFMGASHTYRGFDPRIFAERGYTSYNIGSTAQTPLNGYYVMKKDFKRFNPKLVILEVSPVVLGKDGVESFFDLVINLPFSREMLEMAFALRSPQAINALFGAAEGRFWRPLKDVEQQEITGEKYIAGGYCETLPLAEGMIYKKSIQTIEPLAVQIDYLKKTIEYIKENNADILLVTQPVPKEYVEDTVNYKDVRGTIYDIAKEYGIRYMDFTNGVTLDRKRDFIDNDHLSASGVQKFNSALLEKISGVRVEQAVLN